MSYISHKIYSALKSHILLLKYNPAYYTNGGDTDIVDFFQVKILIKCDIELSCGIKKALSCQKVQ